MWCQRGLGLRGESGPSAQYLLPQLFLAPGGFPNQTARPWRAGPTPDNERDASEGPFGSPAAISAFAVAGTFCSTALSFGFSFEITTIAVSTNSTGVICFFATSSASPSPSYDAYSESETSDSSSAGAHRQHGAKSVYHRGDASSTLIRTCESASTVQVKILLDSLWVLLPSFRVKAACIRREARYTT